MSRGSGLLSRLLGALLSGSSSSSSEFASSSLTDSATPRHLSTPTQQSTRFRKVTRTSTKPGTDTMASSTTQNTAAAPEAPECTICTSILGQPRDDGSVEAGITLPCSHIFGMRCLARTIADRASCPLCRADIPTDIVTDLSRILRGLSGNATGDVSNTETERRQGLDWQALDQREAERDAEGFHEDSDEDWSLDPSVMYGARRRPRSPMYIAEDEMPEYHRSGRRIEVVTREPQNIGRPRGRYTSPDPSRREPVRSFFGGRPSSPHRHHQGPAFQGRRLPPQGPNVHRQPEDSGRGYRTVEVVPNPNFRSRVSTPPSFRQPSPPPFRQASPPRTRPTRRSPPTPSRRRHFYDDEEFPMRAHSPTPPARPSYRVPRGGQFVTELPARTVPRGGQFVTELPPRIVHRAPDSSRTPRGTEIMEGVRHFGSMSLAEREEVEEARARYRREQDGGRRDRQFGNGGGRRGGY